eukprot:9211092-Lingulodinium_polyedra.AAC.1
MVDQHSAALHDALQRCCFDVSTIREMGIEWRLAGIQSAVQLAQYIRSNAPLMDADPAVPAGDIGLAARQRAYQYVAGHVQEYLIHRSPIGQILMNDITQG